MTIGIVSIADTKLKGMRLVYKVVNMEEVLKLNIKKDDIINLNFKERGKYKARVERAFWSLGNEYFYIHLM